MEVATDAAKVNLDVVDMIQTFVFNLFKLCFYS